jgi:hypothetical protein
MEASDIQEFSKIAQGANLRPRQVRYKNILLFIHYSITFLCRAEQLQLARSGCSADEYRAADRRRRGDLG